MSTFICSIDRGYERSKSRKFNVRICYYIFRDSASRESSVSHRKSAKWKIRSSERRDIPSFLLSRPRPPPSWIPAIVAIDRCAAGQRCRTNINRRYLATYYVVKYLKFIVVRQNDMMRSAMIHF